MPKSKNIFCDIHKNVCKFKRCKTKATTEENRKFSDSLY